MIYRVVVSNAGIWLGEFGFEQQLAAVVIIWVKADALAWALEAREPNGAEGLEVKPQDLSAL